MSIRANRFAARGLRSSSRRLSWKNAWRIVISRSLLVSFMKIAAIATIADSVPLIGENRVIASLGLNALRSAVNPGLKALLEVAQLGGKPLRSGEVGFRIAPRINAAGRMDIAKDVIELFSVKDVARAREIAQRLDKLNSERQEEERRIVDGDRAAARRRCGAARFLLHGD